MAKANKIDFEASLAQLENLVDQMEEGDLSLEESLKAFEAGVKLTRECQQALQAAEQKVEVLMRQNDELVAEPLEALDALTDEDEAS
jgi:exodeoxyribonuclease VII small subunit